MRYEHVSTGPHGFTETVDESWLLEIFTGYFSVRVRADCPYPINHVVRLAYLLLVGTALLLLASCRLRHTVQVVIVFLLIGSAVSALVRLHHGILISVTLVHLIRLHNLLVLFY